ncbi:hypothetical protein B566_EDAN010391 [Ephemera danica]|nr:hypothetical protein B566_EDAN010391 [Ephemera danica]
MGRSLDSEADHQIRSSHEWFERGVNQWLDIALYEALHRIKRAVNLGNLTPLDDSFKFSTSAVDTLFIFCQDICRCSVFYAKQISLRVDGMGIVGDCENFVVTEKWCTAINNIEYVRQSIQPFVMELGLNDLVNQLAEFRSPAEADHCRDVLQLVVDNAVETVGNKIAELIEILAVKLCLAMKRLLQECTEFEDLSLEKLMTYLSSNLCMLNSHFSDENFNRTFSVIWERLAIVLARLVDASLDARRPPYYFANLLKTLEVLEGYFSQDDQQQQQQHESSDVPDLIAGGDCAELLEQTKTRLKLHALETAQLVHQYHLSRWEEQQDVTTPSQAQSCGLLTVKFLIAKNTLHVEILNARSIKPRDPNGTCDPYVRVHLLPEERFAGAPKPKTKIHKRDLFPLFDEIFTIDLFVGEAFVKFSNIEHGEGASSLEFLAQMHLPLTRPSHATEYEALKALEHRLEDVMAKDFLKKERAKMV